MKIEELEKGIKGLEEKIKNLNGEKEKAEDSIRKSYKQTTENVGEIVLDKYLQEQERDYFKELYKVRAELEEEYNKENKDKEQIKNLKGKEKELRKTIESFIFDSLKSASDDEKISAGEYLFDKGVLYGCGSLGSFKNPTTCGGCHDGEAIVDALGLRKYVVFYGEREYGIPKEVKEKALENLGKERTIKRATKIKQDLEEITSALQNTKEELQSKTQILSAYKKLDASGTEYEAVEKKMPDFFSEITRKRDRSGVKFATADLKKNIGIILTDDWYYSGSGGSEYGITAIIWRDGKTEEKYFMYRDAYDYRNDDFRYSFEKAQVKKVTDEEVEIELESYRKDTGKFRITQTFKLPKQKVLENILNEEQQKEFQEKISEVEKKLLQDHARPNATMPMYVSLWGFQGTLPYGTDTGQSVPYEQPDIIDRYVDVKKGIAAFVVKAQIDHCAGHGKQYEWCGYIINKDGKITQVTRECAYQLELKDGKKIRMKARALIK